MRRHMISEINLLLQGSNTTAKASGSKSSSFAFSRAGLAVTPGVESCPEDAQAAHVHPLGFFAPEGVRQLCHVEGERPAMCQHLPSLICWLGPSLAGHGPRGWFAAISWIMKSLLGSAQIVAGVITGASRLICQAYEFSQPGSTRVGDTLCSSIFDAMKCHADVRMLDGAPKTPWRLRDYDPSPQMQPAPKRARHSAAAPSGLQPAAQEPPLAAFEPSPGPGASAAAAPVPAGDEQMNAVPESMQVDQDYGGDYRDDHGNDDDDE